MARSEFFCALKLCAPFGRDASLQAVGHIDVWSVRSSAFLHLEGKFESNLHAKRHTLVPFQFSHISKYYNINGGEMLLGN